MKLQPTLEGIYEQAPAGRPSDQQHWLKRRSDGRHTALYRAQGQNHERRWVIGNSSLSNHFKYAYNAEESVCLQPTSAWMVWNTTSDDWQPHTVNAACASHHDVEISDDDGFGAPIMAAIELQGSEAINARMTQYMESQQIPAVVAATVPRCMANVMPLIVPGIVEKCSLLTFSGITRIVAPQLQTLLLSDLPHNLSVLVGDAVPKGLTDEIVGSLKNTVGPAVAREVSNRATGAIYKHLSNSLGSDQIPERLDAIIPRYVNRGLTRSLTQTLTKSVTKASCPALVTAMKFSPEMDSICYACFYNLHGPVHSQDYCGRCVIDPKTMYYTNYWCEYYSEWYANYYTKYYTHKNIDEWQRDTLGMNSNGDDDNVNVS
jgi:hypothetical protein